MKLTLILFYDKEHVTFLKKVIYQFKILICNFYLKFRYQVVREIIFLGTAKARYEKEHLVATDVISLSRNLRFPQQRTRE